jgi:hypothetical protein
MSNKAIFITGHGRSGTTWIGSTFGQAPGALYYNEPCNQPKVRGGDYSAWFRYVPPDGNDLFFEECLNAALKGFISVRAHWLIQRPYRRLLPSYSIVIKEVASFMSIEWVYKRYKPEVLIVVRHPCAVALSEKVKNTPVERPITEILKQTRLIEDHLEPYVAIMKKAKTPYEIYGAVWGARNKVVANLMPHYPEWKILFYENLCENPPDCFRKLFDHFKLPWTNKVQRFITQTTTEEESGTYSIRRVTEKQVDQWKSTMSKYEIEQVRRFVEPFNLPFYNQKTDWF